MKKMNNKGFSLVELIVVVLIMAIIAVALAPQVMRWVENSRQSTDVQNYGEVVTGCNVALGKETVFDVYGSGTHTMTQCASGTWSVVTPSGTTGSGNDGGLADVLSVTLGSNWTTDFGMHSKLYKGKTLTVNVSDGVTVWDNQVTADIS